MIRFIDITKDYFCLDDGLDDPQIPLCAFISTTSDKFILNDSGSHIFHDLDDVREIPNNDVRERCLRLVPEGFFKEK